MVKARIKAGGRLAPGLPADERSMIFVVVRVFCGPWCNRDGNGDLIWTGSIACFLGPIISTPFGNSTTEA